MSRANALLHARGAVGHGLVVAAAAVDDEFDILAAHAGAGDGAARRGDGKLDAGHVRDAPLLHAGSRGNTLVVRGQEGGEIPIRQDGRWQALAPADDCSVSHWNSPGALWLYRALSPMWARPARLVRTRLGANLPPVRRKSCAPIPWCRPPRPFCRSGSASLSRAATPSRPDTGDLPADR